MGSRIGDETHLGAFRKKSDVGEERFAIFSAWKCRNPCTRGIDVATQVLRSAGEPSGHAQRLERTKR